MKRVMKAHLER